ncbi:putative ribonuclease H-like domain-containing protein [Tanacetum coccineum]|uniref:Ribonuclease H-like domain-containing protein n=1 Tax=Tanacetum coccineum TaxID=301880 RepID=A0ABQ4ZAG2_9ASTR
MICGKMEDIKLLKREIYLRDLDITELKRKLELATKEKDEVQLTVQKFENSSKNLSKLLDRQIMDKCKTGLGYNVVPPPYTGNFMPPKSDLVYPSLDDFVDVNESVVEKPTVETNEPETSRKENGAPIIEDWVSDSDEENVPKVKTVEMFNKPSFAKINFVKSTEQVKSPRKISVDKNRFGLILLNTAGLVNTVQSRTAVNNAGPMKKVINNAYSTTRRPFNKITTANNSNFTKNVNTVKGIRVNTSRPKAVISAVKKNKGNAVKALACWVWRPKHKVLDHVSRNNGASMSFKIFNYIDVQGRSKSVMADNKEIEEHLFPLEAFQRGNLNRKDFKLTDESHVLLKVPRRDNMYSVDLKNVVPQGGLTCLFAKATPDESNLWHRRLGHVQKYVMMQNLKDSHDARFKPSGEEEKKDVIDTGNKDSKVPSTEEPIVNHEKDASVNCTNTINTASPIVNTASIENNVVDENIVYGCDDDPNMPELEEIVYSDDDKDVSAEADINNLDTHITCLSPVVYKNKKDERGIMIKNKARLVTQGYTQEEGIDYDKFFSPVARIEAIRLFLAYASFIDFMVYQMDVKSAFLYENIKEEVYVCQPPGFEDPDFPNRVYKVEKALYGLYQAPKAWYETLSTYLLDNGFQRGKINKTLFIKRDKSLQVKQKEDEIFISQDKYVNEILNKFGFSDVKTARTPMETQKALLKDADGEYVDEHLYRSMIGSLMYLTSSRPDIMFAVCACARFQVNPKVSHLHAVKRIFRYLKGASLDRKSTTGGCQFLGCRLISWQCKKQTVVANSTTEAEYIAASNCCGQVLWIQNQLLDYGYNFMQTKIHIDNESTIYIVKNPVFHSKTKHIEIRHHFIRDSNEKKLIQMIKIYTDQNVADLLTKAFDVSRFQYLIASIGMLNL